MNIKELTKAAEHLHSLAPEAFAPIANEAQLNRAICILKAMDDAMSDDDNHPLRDIAEQLMQRILKYEEEHYPIPDMFGAEYLEFLIEKHHLSQHQLAKETGIPQNIISDLISGKCEMTTRYICIFADYFNISPKRFLPIELIQALSDK